MSELTHFAGDGRPHMVDVSAKPVGERVAVARGFVAIPAALLARVDRKSVV